ncbi:hypothetical protein [Hymenobacter busanensis]|uniref:hypothetical protein n=1 Tax=Hymenobacter busanensis TaxID=2607656 RepID=UPI0013670CAB|nr:hypothetical protein [Hymenobacter busanensis]QHJ05823.1 hypothetical protein GUY19_00340 [Hymenobacter busanensis]
MLRQESDTNVLDALVKLFCDACQGYPAKKLFIYGNRNGNNKQTNSNLTFYHQII